MNLFSFKNKKGEELNHWIAFAEGFSFSSLEFYDAVEKRLADHKIPSMDVTRIEFAEGGLLSAKRIYLRMIRERLVFDTCAAPFGTDYFFSCRTVYISPVIEIWHCVVLLAVFSGIYALLEQFLGVTFAFVALASLLIAIAQLFRNTVALGLADLDAALIKTPVIGPIYERWFRKDTYYRHDTRLMYLDTVPKLIQHLVEETTAAKGVKLTRQYEKAPILGELYKRVPVAQEPK